MAVLVTGASGMIGAAVALALERTGHEVVRAARNASGSAVAIGEIGPQTDWRGALGGVDTVVHLAGIAHARAPRAAYARVNVEGARALAKQSAAASVRRFIFISSVLAMADKSGEAPLTDSDVTAPRSAYGRSKRAAEDAVEAETSLDVVTLRPPLVIGPGARANADLLLRLADSGVPLPIDQFTARRNFIALSTLVAAIERVVASPSGPAGTFFVADQPGLTLAEAVEALREALGRPRRIFAAPIPGPGVVGRALQIDDSLFRAAYGYGPLHSRHARFALGDAARAWKSSRQ